MDKWLIVRDDPTLPGGLRVVDNWYDISERHAHELAALSDGMYRAMRAEDLISLRVEALDALGYGATHAA
jgi:hypothetical protein